MKNQKATSSSLSFLLNTILLNGIIKIQNPSHLTALDYKPEERQECNWLTVMPQSWGQNNLKCHQNSRNSGVLCSCTITFTWLKASHQEKAKLGFKNIMYVMHCPKKYCTARPKSLMCQCKKRI